jgi:hypothetical protein
MGQTVQQGPSGRKIPDLCPKSFWVQTVM